MLPAAMRCPAAPALLQDDAAKHEVIALGDDGSILGQCELADVVGLVVEERELVVSAPDAMRADHHGPYLVPVECHGVLSGWSVWKRSWRGAL